MLVKDVLQNQLMCTPDANLQDVVQTMDQNDFYIIPVVESLIHKNPIGVVTEKSICRRSIAEGLNPLKLNAGRVMNGDYIAISPDANLEQCRDAMRAAQACYLVVVDENNVCRGLITKDEVERILTQPRVIFTPDKIPLQTKTISYYDRIF